MSPLYIEVFHPVDMKWIRVGEVHPHDPQGSMSDNKPGKKRDVYVFKCAGDDSKSIIYRSKIGMDSEIGRFREVKTTGFEIIKELKNGKSLEMDMKTDVSSAPRRIRFTHKTGAF